MNLAILISVVLLFTLSIGVILCKRDNKEIQIVNDKEELEEIIEDSYFDEEII